jgi:TolB-like protein
MTRTLSAGAMPADGYAFGEFVLDLRSGALRRGGTTLPLRPKAFDVLVYLIGKQGQAVAKTELIDKVWRDVIVTENSLAQCIKEVRQALGDEAQAIIKTVAKRGYLFAVPVNEIDESIAPTPAASPPLPDRPSIAVLPFVNMSGEADQEHFADGITEDLITGLARIHWLFVIARNSSFAFKNRAGDVKDVARRLGVRYVLEGSVRRAGRQLRITAQLVDGTTGIHHWAERYDRELGDIFALQDEITRSVAGAIEPRLLAAEGVRALNRSNPDIGAWELVARARTYFWRMTPGDCETAIGALNSVVDAYPDYAPARSLLSFCLVFGSHMGWVDHIESLPAGERHAIRAISLDDRDPWGHMALAYLALMERRTEEAIAGFRRAVEMNPNSAAAHSFLSLGLAFAGVDAEAIGHGNEAIRLSPVDPEMARTLGGIGVAHYLAGRFEDAARVAADSLRLRPGFHGGQRLHCASLAQAGRIDAARALFAKMRAEQPQLSARWVRLNVPYQTPELMGRFLDGLRKAGLEN